MGYSIRDSWKRAAGLILLAGALLGGLLLVRTGVDARDVLGEDEVELRFESYFAFSPSVREMIREFEHLCRRRHEATDGEYPLYKISVQQSANRGESEDPTRFVLSLIGGDPADVVFFGDHVMAKWASIDAFTPLRQYMERDREAWERWQEEKERRGRDVLPPWPGAEAEAPRAEGARALAAIEPIDRGDYFEACWRQATYTDPKTGDADVYGIPCWVNSRALIYNKDILVRHGYTNAAGEARPPRNWDELREMAVGLTERDEQGNMDVVGFIPNYGNAWLYMYGWQNGGRFMSEDRTTVTMDDPPIVDALDYVVDIYDRLGGVQEVNAFGSSFQSGALDPFILGKVAMKIDGVWSVEDLAKYGENLNFGCCPAPMPQEQLDRGREPISWIGGSSYAIPANSDHKQGAWDFIRFLRSRRAQQIRCAAKYYENLAKGQSYIPTQDPNRSHNRWAYEHYVVDNDSLKPELKHAIKVFNDLLPVSKNRPVTPVGQKLWDAQLSATDDAVYHRRTPQEACEYHNAQVQRELNELLYPAPGVTITDWTWFIVLYGAILAALAVWGVRNYRRRDTGGPGTKQWYGGLISAAPWIIGFVALIGGPLLFSIVLSFCRYDVLSPAVFIGLDNFSRMFVEDDLFFKSLGNTVFMIIGVPLGLATGLGMALLLTQKVRGVALWRTLFYIPSIVPHVAASILWIWIFNPSGGLLNQALGIFGLEGPLWLQDPRTAKPALILMSLWAAGGTMIIWIAGLKSISESYYEAAAIDGASAWQKFRFITLPMLTPYILFNLIMGMIITFQVFTQAFIMTGGGPVNSTLFYVYHLFNQAFRYLNMGYAAAMAWFLFLIIAVLTFFQLKASKKWVHYEGG
ncbi:extracellular solute-binding protein [Kiritimatiella glycovorans]|uniref:Sugar transport system permease protein n=1 Tax=Kiritimatiella glycovorans TaxID=1307763 RepID=A0A0G3EBD7_9BACT|nr:extracellular solute-binding protein [Kiritimatiella glycovorans]AKJ63608.1 sugar transport system permease protein [Kiritimatiella glycovorans]